MSSFSSAKDYLNALQHNADLAIVPLQLAADSREVTRAAIDRMLRMRQLTEIKIGKGRFVKASDLTKLIKDRQTQIRKVRTYLEKLAKQREKVFYEPVMNILGLDRLVPANRTNIGSILGEISEQTYAESKVLLSAIVHRKSTGETIPGEGFILLAKAMGLRWKNEREFVRREVEKVWDFYAP
jgi:hypothetical protein